MSLLYFFVKNISKIGLPLYFGRLEINGREHIPSGAPYIIAPNHQSAFLDAVLMGVYNPRPVHFLTRSDVFVPPFIRALRALNMMPVYRIRDGYDKLSKNDEVFATCQALLAKGAPILIFPEGNMDEGHHLRPLTKGTSRMAVQSQEKMHDDLLILPVGINYFQHDRPRYKCIINFGQPLNVRSYLNTYKTHKATGLITLRDDLSAAIKALLLIAEKEDYNIKVQALHRNNERYNFPDIKGKIERYELGKSTSYPYLNWLPKVLTLFNPLAIIGVHLLLTKLIKDRQFISSLKYILGLFLSLIWWSITLIVCTIIWNVKVGIIATTCSIIMLFLRSEIKKYTDPI